LPYWAYGEAGKDYTDDFRGINRAGADDNVDTAYSNPCDSNTEGLSCMEVDEMNIKIR
jgi:hypothetical protein